MENLWWLVTISQTTVYLKAVIKRREHPTYRDGTTPIEFFSPGDGGIYNARLSKKELENIDTIDRLRGYNHLFFRNYDNAIAAYLDYVTLLEQQRAERERAYKVWIGDNK